MTTKRRNTEVRQKQIINAAREMIVKNGSEHVTIRRIARAVGISEAAIYRHFKSKADILYLLADHIEENLVGDIERALTVHVLTMSCATTFQQLNKGKVSPTRLLPKL